MKKILYLLIIVLIIGCSNNEKTKECSTFLECLDGTYWTNNNNMSVWTFNNDTNGSYLEVYITGDNCYKYENNFIVNAEFKYQTKDNLSEDFNGSNWLYTILNDTIIEKTKATGGNTTYFYKSEKSYSHFLILVFVNCFYLRNLFRLPYWGGGMFGGYLGVFWGGFGGYLGVFCEVVGWYSEVLLEDVYR